MKPARTTEVQVFPEVIADLLLLQAEHDRLEVGALLVGYEEGHTLHVHDMVPTLKPGTSTRIEFTPLDFDRAMDRLREGQMIVGWAHSHPTYGPWMSGIDRTHQENGQEMYPDYIGLVFDAYHDQGAAYKFFRLVNGKLLTVPRKMKGSRWNTKGRYRLKTGIKPPSKASASPSAAAAPSDRRPHAPVRGLE